MAEGTGQASAEPRELSARDVRLTAAPKHRAFPRRGRFFSFTGILVGLLGLAAALAMPLAPVITHDVTVSWPQAGRLPESTLAFFVPYRPTEVHVEVPCPVVRAGQRQGHPTTLVSTRLPGAPTEGFAVTTAQDHVIVLAGGREALRKPLNELGKPLNELGKPLNESGKPLTGSDCSVILDSDASGSTARIGGAVGTVSKPVADILAFATQLSPQEAAGIQVRARTSNWFENSPTASKQALIGVQLAMVTGALVLLVGEDRRRRVPVSKAARRPGSPLRWFVDIGLFGVLGGWLVVGPNTPDDSFASMTMRNGLSTGNIGNYYRWENASEAPFTLVQNLLEPLTAISISPLALRIPSVLAALCTWLLLSRPVLGVVLPAHSRHWGVRALAALSFVAWWLPFGLGVRPEPFAALGITAVLACVLLGVSRRDGTGRTWLGLGALAAGLSLAVNPMGVTAFAPVLVFAPRIWRLLGRAKVALTALLACLASTGVVVMFADQSLFGASQATRLHEFYGPNVPWYQEILRYQYLLGFDFQGDIARRTPILITIVLVVCALLLASRNAHALPGMRLAPVPAACLLIGLALMWLTPSKWTHYFGALAGLGAAALTAGVVFTAVAAKRWAADRAVVLIGLVCAVLIVVAAATAFAGKNNWFLHSGYGGLWENQPIHPLNSPLPWLLVAVSLLGVAFRRTRDVRRMLVSLPAVIGVLAAATMVTLVLASFATAPLRESDSYTIGGHNLASLTGGSCGVADHVVATPDVPGGVLAPLTGTDETVGFKANTGYVQENVPPEGSGERLWGSIDGGQISTGWLRTRWFALPPIPASREIAVSVAGRSGDGNRLALEFGDAGGVLGSATLDDTGLDDDETPAYPSDRVKPDLPQDDPSWRTLHVDSHDIPPGSDRVRVRAVDGTTDPAGWIATTGPRIREIIPLPDFMRGKAPVLVDWSMTWSMPCLRDMPRVGGGLVEPPAYLINPPNALGFDGTAAYERGIGGSFAGVREVGHQHEVPTRLLGVEDAPQHAEWGHLVAVEYPLPGNGHDVRSVPVPRWGWRGEE